MIGRVPVKRRELTGGGLVPVRSVAGQRQVLRSWCLWPAGLVQEMRDAALDS
jgi:hypothetical protein